MALSESFQTALNKNVSSSNKVQGYSGRRRQLHILYLVNDILHHTRYHSDSPAAYSTFIGNFQSCLVDLFRAASGCSPETFPNQHRKIRELLGIWTTNDYLQSSLLKELGEAVSNAAQSGFTAMAYDLKPANGMEHEALGHEKRDAPFIMPASHGDPSTPFYDLPAGNMLPHIIPNSSLPINPQLVKPLQFMAGPADESLATIVKNFLANVESLDDLCCRDGGTDIDVDQLGQCVLRDEITGEVLDGEGYYGWSRAFCEKMKHRAEGVKYVSRTVGPEDSVDEKSSPHKRRRYSDSGRSQSRGVSRSSSLGSRENRRYRKGSRSSSRSRSGSRKRRQYRSLRSPSRSLSRSTSYSPPQTISAFQPPSLATDPQIPLQAYRPGSSPRPLPLPQPFTQGFLHCPGGAPIPPPPPPNYQGQWPPPPPPMPISHTAGPQSLVPAPPPPITGQWPHYNQGSTSFAQGPQSGVQGQAPSHSGKWGQQPGYGDNNFAGEHDRGSPAFRGNAQSGRGRGSGRGARVR